MGMESLGNGADGEEDIESFAWRCFKEMHMAPTVLIVDDNPDDVEITRMALEEKGIQPGQILPQSGLAVAPILETANHLLRFSAATSRISGAR